MSSIDVSSVLSQIRSLSAASGIRPLAPANPVAAATAAGAPTDVGFGSLLKQGVDRVATQQNEVGKLQQAFELGDPDTDLATVMVASAKAQVSFRAMVEVRNRMVSAYQDVMNMPL